MWKLIAEAIGEIVSRPLAVLKVFWPLLVYTTLAVAIAIAGLQAHSFLPENSGRLAIGLSILILVVGMLLLAAFAVAPVAVNWHRVVILNETPTWKPPSFRLYLAPYALRLTCFSLGFVLIMVVSDLAWKLWVWAVFAEQDDYFISNVAWVKYISMQQNAIALFVFRHGATIGELIVNGIYLLLLGRWTLTLPAIAVEQVRKSSFAPSAKILLAIFTINAVPICLSGAAQRYYTTQKYAHGYEPIWQDIAVGIVALLSFLIALTILSVAYRKHQ